MDQNIKENLSDILKNSKSWILYEIEYYKLTAAQKFTILLSTLIMVSIMMLLGVIALALLTLSLVDLFKDFMSPVLANLSVCGIIVVICILIFLLRKQLIINPISKFITKLFLEKRDKDETTQK